MVSFNKSKYRDYLILNHHEIMVRLLNKRKEKQNYCSAVKKQIVLCVRGLIK